MKLIYPIDPFYPRDMCPAVSSRQENRTRKIKGFYQRHIDYLLFSIVLLFAEMYLVAILFFLFLFFLFDFLFLLRAYAFGL